MTRQWICVAVALMIGVLPGAAAELPLTWDGLVAVKAKRLDAVWLAPDADFRDYTKVMLDPTEVALRKNWLRDYNQSASRGISNKITDADIQRAFETIRTKTGEVFAREYGAAGYQVVTAPGPDVLRVRTGVINVSVSAPDMMSATRTYSREAGEATLVMEARDAQSGALLGRAVDQRLAGDNTLMMRNRVTNRADFTRLFTSWAKESVAGLNELKALSASDIARLKK